MSQEPYTIMIENLGKSTFPNVSQRSTLKGGVSKESCFRPTRLTLSGYLPIQGFMKGQSDFRHLKNYRMNK